jgi:hypothetical protein
MNLSDVDRVRYNTEEKRFTAVHGACRSHRHGVSGVADDALRQVLSFATDVAGAA